MEEGVFEVETEYARTESGLILPNRKGVAVLVLGLELPGERRDSTGKQLGIEMSEGQGAVYMSMEAFTLAALDMARALGWTPPQKS